MKQSVSSSEAVKIELDGVFARLQTGDVTYLIPLASVKMLVLG